MLIKSQLTGLKRGREQFCKVKEIQSQQERTSKRRAAASTSSSSTVTSTQLCSAPPLTTTSSVIFTIPAVFSLSLLANSKKEGSLHNNKPASVPLWRRWLTSGKVYLNLPFASTRQLHKGNKHTHTHCTQQRMENKCMKSAWLCLFVSAWLAVCMMSTDFDYVTSVSEQKERERERERENERERMPMGSLFTARTAQLITSATLGVWAQWQQTIAIILHTVVQCGKLSLPFWWSCCCSVCMCVQIELITTTSSSSSRKCPILSVIVCPVLVLFSSSAGRDSRRPIVSIEALSVSSPVTSTHYLIRFSCRKKQRMAAVNQLPVLT